MSTRPDWDSYFSEMAKIASLRSTCPRAQVGAVLVNTGRVLGTGYNGSPSGLPHCLDAGCILHTDTTGANHCIRSVHAEANALVVSTIPERRGELTLYCTHTPCIECSKLLINAGVNRVVYTTPYYDSRSGLYGYHTQLELLVEAGVLFVGPPIHLRTYQRTEG